MADGILRRTDAWMEVLEPLRRPRAHLTLSLDACALLVIDANHYFMHKDGRGYLPAAPHILPHLLMLIDAFARMKAPVFFTRHGHPPTESGMFQKFFSDVIVAGEGDWRLLDTLPVSPTDTIIDKSTYDAFFGTDLGHRLDGAGVRQVLMCGVLTQMCVETTARAAFCRGYEVFVTVDATATTSEQAHLASLTGMASCAAIPMTTQEVLHRCHR